MRAPVRRLAIASATALAVGALAGAPAAQAAPVFTESQLSSDYFGHSDGSCNTDSETGSPTVDLPVTENGPAVSATQTVDTVVSDGGTDSQTGTGTISGTGSVSSVGSDLKEINLAASGQWAVTQTEPTSDCFVHFAANLSLDFQFVVTQPGFLNVNVKNRGNGTYSEIYLEMVTPTSSPYFDSYGQGLEFDSSTRIYLPAGTYDGYAYSQVGADDVTTASSGSGTSAVKATFSPIGSQTEAAEGKGKRFVNLPANARSCAADTVTASITDKAKRAKLIRKVLFFVNGDRVKTVRDPGRGDVVVLTGIPDGEAADVRAVAKLVKKANGEKRNPKEVTASYEACGPSA